MIRLDFSIIFFSGKVLNIKGTLMQIWKIHCMLGSILKLYSKNFTFLKLRILELFTQEVCIFLKKLGYFLTYSTVSACLYKSISYISGVYNSESKQCYYAEPSSYFYVKMKILIDFHNCISLPLKTFRF